MLNPTKGKFRRSTKRSKPSDRHKLLQREKSLEKLKNDFRVLSGVCRIIEKAQEGRKVFEKVLNLINRSVEFSQASLFLLDKENNKMQEVASVGKTVDLIGFVKFERGMGFSAWVARERRPILLSNLHRRKGGETIKSFIAMPLILEEELFGVLNLSHIRAHAFEPGDVEFLQLASSPISLALERMRYHEESEELRTQMEKARERCMQLEEEIDQMRRVVPTSQLLENLNQKIKTPLAGIAENAQFLLDAFSPQQESGKSRTKREVSLEYKRGLRHIRNEAYHVTKATERLLKRSLT